MTLNDLLSSPQYSLRQEVKESILLDHLKELTRHHEQHCAEYGRIVRGLFSSREPRVLADVPYLPVGLFKSRLLASVPPSEIFKTVTSSGTTGQQVSRVALDRETASRQTTALSRIMMHILGHERLPMIIIDTQDVLKNRAQPSARAAGVLGMMNFGRNHFWALDQEMNLDIEGLKQFLRRCGNGQFLLFGFTFMAWAYFFQQIKTTGVELSNGILIHSGGWKKLQDRAVTNDEFKAMFGLHTGLARIYNFYGMAEQSGSVFLEGEDGRLYPPNFADVVVRDPITWEEVPTGTPGILQVLSLLPRSYPGHSILTEDLGVVDGVDMQTCGRLGKAFRVLGRLPKAELRGCSDTHAQERAA